MAEKKTMLIVSVIVLIIGLVGGGFAGWYMAEWAGVTKDACNEKVCSKWSEERCRSEYSCPDCEWSEKQCRDKYTCPVCEYTKEKCAAQYPCENA